MVESIEELRVFCQIVESGSLTAAARALGMPVNTVSRRLAALEERLDRTLLQRTTRSQSLSEAGRTFLIRARRILDEVQLAEDALVRETEGLSGTVRVGVPSILTAEFFVAMAPLVEANPGLRIQVQVNDRPVSPIAAGLDVVVIGGQLTDSALIARKLTDVRFVLMASRTYLDRYGTPRTPSELAEHRTLHFRRDPPQSTWTLLDSSGSEHVVGVQGRVEVDDGRGLLDAARAGLGICMLSTRLSRSDPALVQVLPDFHGGQTAVYAIYPTSGDRSARLRGVVDALRTSLVTHSAQEV